MHDAWQMVPILKSGKMLKGSASATRDYILKYHMRSLYTHTKPSSAQMRLTDHSRLTFSVDAEPAVFNTASSDCFLKLEKVS